MFVQQNATLIDQNSIISANLESKSFCLLLKIDRGKQKVYFN